MQWKADSDPGSRTDIRESSVRYTLVRRHQVRWKRQGPKRSRYICHCDPRAGPRRSQSRCTSKDRRRRISRGADAACSERNYSPLTLQVALSANSSRRARLVGSISSACESRPNAGMARGDARQWTSKHTTMKVSAAVPKARLPMRRFADSGDRYKWRSQTHEGNLERPPRPGKVPSTVLDLRFYPSTSIHWP